MGNQATSNDKQRYRMFCGPPVQRFSHWQLVKHGNGNSYKFAVVYKSKNGLPMMLVDDEYEKDTDPRTREGKFATKRSSVSTRSGSRKRE